MLGVFGRDIIRWVGKKMWEKAAIAVQEFPYSRPAARVQAEVHAEEVPLIAIHHM